MTRLLGEMAHGLDKYRAAVRNSTLGALGEYLKFRICVDAGLNTDRTHGHLASHWDLEWQRLLSKGLAPELRTQVKFKKSGRLSVALREVERLRTEEDVDRSFAEWARKQVNKDFKVNIRRPVNPDVQPFWDEVNDVIQTILEPRALDEGEAKQEAGRMNQVDDERHKCDECHACCGMGCDACSTCRNSDL